MEEGENEGRDQGEHTRKARWTSGHREERRDSSGSRWSREWSEDSGSMKRGRREIEGKERRDEASSEESRAEERSPPGKRRIRSPTPERMMREMNLAKERNGDFTLRPDEVLFLSDFLMKEIPQSDKLNKVAWDRRWRMLMRRGAKMAELNQLVDMDGLSEIGYLVICGGSNDLMEIALEDNIARVDRRMKEVLYELEKIIVKAEQRKILTGIVVPPPREGINEEDRGEWIVKLRDMVASRRSTTIIDIQGGWQADEFKSRFLYDGTHIETNTFPAILDSIIHQMGWDFTVKVDGSLERKDFVPKERCWVCGDIHIRGVRPCEWAIIEYCHRCGGKRHNQRVCVHRMKMCTRCGRRGHSQKLCDFEVSNG